VLDHGIAFCGALERVERPVPSNAQPIGNRRYSRFGNLRYKRGLTLQSIARKLFMLTLVAVTLLAAQSLQAQVVNDGATNTLRHEHVHWRRDGRH